MLDQSFHDLLKKLPSNVFHQEVEHQNKEKLHLLSFPNGGLGCNCSFLINEQEKTAYIIDPGNDSKRPLEIIKLFNLKIQGLIHTHAHFDHIGKSPSLSMFLQCPLYLHPQDIFLFNSLKGQSFYFGEMTDDPIEVLKDHYLEDERNFYLNQFTFKTTYTPGHTPGSCCFSTQSFSLPFLFSGDTLFYGSIGRTDLPGGDFSQIKKSLKQKILKLDDETIVIPGHGPLTTIGRERKQNPYLL